MYERQMKYVAASVTHWTRTSTIEAVLQVMGFSVNVELIDLDTNPELVFGEPEYVKS